MKKVVRVVVGVALVAGSLQVPVAAQAAGEACAWVGTVEVRNTGAFPAQSGMTDILTQHTVTARNTDAGCEVTRAVTYRDAFQPTIGGDGCGVRTFTREEAQTTTTATLAATLETYTEGDFGPPVDYDVVRLVASAPAVPATVYTDEVNTCTGEVLGSTVTGETTADALALNTNRCVQPGAVGLLEVPGPNAQAFTTGCGWARSGATYNVTATLQRTDCDPTVDSDGGGEGDCAEFAAGRDPGNAADDVQPVDLPPVAVADRATTSRFSSVAIRVLANDRDPEGGALTLQSCTKPSFGTVRVWRGKAVYTPWRGTWGTARFTCTIADAAGQQATAPVRVTVTKRR